ncbi:hypothetical protein PInf_006714 [Phytophthora infestans]|nr:hypothetical protein PInf_006714 [Phytophthora infestans]
MDKDFPQNEQRIIEADTEANEDERRRGYADVISTAVVTRGAPAINSAFELEDVQADRTPVLHDVSYHLPKFEDDGTISDASTSSAVEETSAVGTKEDASATEDSAIKEGDLEECSEQVLRDDQPVIDDRAKFEVIRLSIVGEANSAMSTLTTISANSEGLNWTVKTSNHGDEGEAQAKCGVDRLSSADVVNSALGTPKACTIQSAAPNDDPSTADSALETLGAKNGLNVVRRHDDDTIYLGDKFEHADVRSAMVVDSADTGPHDDECNLTRDPTETLRQHYVAIAATEDEQEDDVDDSKTDIFERSGTDLELTDYAPE